ncbi:MAG: right-handed parallel beta-helix repeat-containing protein [Thermoplasmata archaeon]|nr:MAG: right-handed parallel beta-helix repeat-containing protein [Thermoplasmata archaeon]
MKYRLISVGIAFLIVTAGFLGLITFESKVVRASTIIYVGSGVGNDSTSISGGIALANPGDTVFVYGGVYTEALLIDKTINLIGEDKNTTIIDGIGKTVVWLSSVDWVNITGFTLTNGSFGIYSNQCSNNAFINNIVHDNSFHGFYFTGDPYFNNKIIGNIVYSNQVGIKFEEDSSVDEEYFSNNSIINNIVYNNTNDGIHIAQGTGNYIDQGGSNFIIDNIVYNNGLGSITPWAGIRIIRSNDNVVMGNTVYNNDNGIYFESIWYKFYSTSKNYISGNKVYNNDDSGIVLIAAINNTFIDNSIFNNKYNVYMDSQSSGNNFINCTLSNPTYYDFNLTDDSHAIALNTSFNKNKVFFGDMDSTLTVKWFMHVNVIYFNGDPVSYANIWVRDYYDLELFGDLADFNGWARWITVTEYVAQDINGDNIGDRAYFTPHSVSATDGLLWGFADPFMDVSKVVVIVLGAPTYLLPPKNLRTKVVNNGENVELEWDPSTSSEVDHYLIYRADSATEFDFFAPLNSSITWSNPLSTNWIDPDPIVTAVDDDFYYAVRAANFDESDISTTTNTAGIWTRTFQPGVSTFSLPLEPFVEHDTEFYCQDMNASFIKWMSPTTHNWMQHSRGLPDNNTLVELGEAYEIKFENTTKYTFCGFPGAMIIFEDDITFLGFDPMFEAKSLEVWVEPNGDVNLTWWEPPTMAPGDYYEIYYSYTRDGFFGDIDFNYYRVEPPVNFETNTTTHFGAGANNPGSRLYYMVVPFNALGTQGASTYSVGIWTEEYSEGYDTMGIPLKLDVNHTADWYCDNIPDTVGINYFDYTGQRWCWHSIRMPEGAFDTVLEMTKGYQISTSNSTKFMFIGI